MKERKMTLVSLGLLILAGFVFFQGSQDSNCACVVCSESRCRVIFTVWNDTSITQTFTTNGNQEEAVTIPPGAKVTVEFGHCQDRKKDLVNVIWVAGFWCSVDKVFKIQKEGYGMYECSSEQLIIIN